MRSRTLLFALLVVAGCASTIIPLADPAHGGVPITLTPTGAVPLEVVTHANPREVRDPLPLDGTRASFADLELTLGHAVASATVPWAEAQRAKLPSGDRAWTLLVELAQAQARLRDGVVSVRLLVRATLRARAGDRYIAQSQAQCSRSAAVAPRAAAPVFFDCMARVGRELAGWLGAVEPL